MFDARVALRWITGPAACWLLIGGLTGVEFPGAAGAEEPGRARRVDPAAWGSDHVGHPFPEYMTGDECLFCHRSIGQDWGSNRHQLTIRAAAADDPAFSALRAVPMGHPLAAETGFSLGAQRMTRFLKRSDRYGQLELLSTAFAPDPGAAEDKAKPAAGVLKGHDRPTWDAESFANRCAGCHTTAVTPSTRSFSAISLDCFVCHGDVNLEHTKDQSRVLLSTMSREPRQVISLCGQCHLRGGRSHSTGLPYPNTFVAGDNLFRDFRVDLSDDSINQLPAVERHIFLNTRDVAVFDQTAMTCLTCHRVHAQSAEQHQHVERRDLCASCHVPGSTDWRLMAELLPPNRWQTHSHTCDY